MTDYCFINERMAIGGHIHNKEEFDALRVLGITHFLCLLAPEPHEVLHDYKYNLSNMAHTKCLETWDSHEAQTKEWFETVLDFVLPTLAKPHTKIYIHCAAGRSRSALAWYVVFRALGFEQLEAETMIKYARPQVDFWDGYRKSAELVLKELGYVN